VSLPATALVSIEEAQEYCRATTEELPALERYVVAACDWFAKFTDRQLYSAAITDAMFSGDGTQWLMLHEWPVTAFSAASYWTGTGWESIDLTYAVIDPRAVKVYLRDQVWPIGTLNLKATYTAGYATVPEDLKQAVLELMLENWRKADRQIQGVQFQTFSGQVLSFSMTDPFPKSVQAVADRYRRLPF